MTNRLLLHVIEVFKSGLVRSWTSGWSVPTDEICMLARLPSRHAEATGGVAAPWLQKTAQAAAVKWRDEVCGARAGQVRKVTIVKVEPTHQSRQAHGMLRVTARYCGRTHDGGFRFRHGISDAGGSEIMRYVTQVHFNPPPELPAYPAVHVDAGETIEAA